MKDISIFNSKCLFIIRAFLGKPGQGISGDISFALLIIYAEVILKELLGLADLANSQTFYINELAKVIMISKHKSFMLAAL